jgi:hypothetical protein
MLVKGPEEYYKLNLNGSYGYDGKNDEKYVDHSIKSRREAQFTQIAQDFIDTTKIADDKYLITKKKRSFGCDTCIQEAYFTLDNAKYWYLNFIYNFMYKCIDMDKVHFIEGDTDSMYFAIAGDPDEPNTQQFKHVVKDQAFYDEHYADWFPDPELLTEEKEGKTLEEFRETKKLLGLAIEKQGDNMIALAPKSYTIWNNDSSKATMKAKGASKANMGKRITPDSYIVALDEAVRALNGNFMYRKVGEERVMCQVTTPKNALTCIHTKMIVLDNESCAPFVHGVRATNYIIK